MHTDCDECSRLGTEYALVTRYFLKLEGRLRMAETSRDERSVRELSPLLENAAEEQARVRRLMENHAQPLTRS